MVKTAFALQTARTSRGNDDGPVSIRRRNNSLFSTGTLVLNTLTLKQSVSLYRRKSRALYLNDLTEK